MEATTVSANLKQYQENQVKVDAEFIRLVNNGLLFRLFLLQKLPMGFIAGLRVKSISAEKCEISVPYKWLNKNPFRSTYFAVLSMAAEMSSGMISMMGTFKSKPSVAVLVTRIEADFQKKATGITTFTCNEGKKIRAAIEEAVATGEGTSCTTTSTGISENGTIEAVFRVTWSFKMRKN